MATKQRVPQHAFAPSISRRLTSFGAQIVLWNGSLNAGGYSIPERIPNQVVIEHDTGDIFGYIDDAGAANTITFLTAGVTVIPMSPLSIETSTTCVAVTVFWHQR